MKLPIVEIFAMILCLVFVVASAPLADSSEEDFADDDSLSTTYKYADIIEAYTFSPFAPRTSSTTTTTSVPTTTTTERSWWSKIFG